MKIVDMHCHILPGIDDGSENMDKSLAMLRKATEQNIYSFIATPHASGRYPKSQPDRVKELCQELEKCAQKEISSQIREHAAEPAHREPGGRTAGDRCTVSDELYFYRRKSI